MSQTRRFSRFGLIVATGLFGLISFVPGGAAVSQASTSGGHQLVHVAKGDNWCC